MAQLTNIKKVSIKGTILGTGFGKNRFVRPVAHLGIQHNARPAITNARDLLSLISWTDTVP